MVWVLVVWADDVQNASVQVGGDLLGKSGYPGPGGADDLPGVRLGIAGKDPEHGAFAGSVDAEQADAVAPLDMEFHIVKQGVPAVTQTHVF